MTSTVFPPKGRGGDTPPPSRPVLIGKRECIDAGMVDGVTVGELVVAAAFAGRRRDERRRRLYLATATRKLLRAQKENRRSG
jgi:hypothetical protein